MGLNTPVAVRGSDAIILCSRLLLILLFVVSGWGKLSGFTAAVDYMARTGVPMPAAAAAVAIAMELGVGSALAVGLLTRPLALLLALFTLATALIGHPFWSLEGAARNGASVNFYKNLAIIGGLLLLYVTGAGRYSVDALRLGRARAEERGSGLTSVG